MAITEQGRDDFRRLIVIGGSAGGVDALIKIVSALPNGLAAPVLIVLHVGPKSILPQVLGRYGSLPISHALDGETIEKGRVYVAPPNYHLLVKPGYLRVIMGPREDYHRPAINPVFRTAARAYGNRAVGVILSGALDDGAIGLKAIKHNGGTAIVQDPREAVIPDMPLNAIRKDEVDQILKIRDIPPALVKLSKTRPQGYGRLDGARVEPDILELQMEEMKRRIISGRQTDLTCPECGGAIYERKEEGLLNFRCHVGHAFSAAVMEEAKNGNAEAALWNAIRILEEKADLLKRIAPQMEGHGKEGPAGRYEAEARKAHEGAELIRKYVYEEEKSRSAAGKRRTKKPGGGKK